MMDAQAEKNKEESESEEDEEESSDSKEQQKNVGENIDTSCIDELNGMDPKLLDQIIATDAPELRGLLTEFKESLNTATLKLKPLIEKIQAKEIQSTAAGMSYLEMKYNLMISYCTFLSYYLLLKLEGKKVENHPVILRLAHIKSLLEKLRPLDQKLQYQVDKMLKEAAQPEVLKYKANLKDMADSESEVEEQVKEDMLSDESEVRSVSVDPEEQVYKAPKSRVIEFEEDAKANKKARQKEKYEKKRIGKSELIRDMAHEQAELPEELHGGMGGGKLRRNK